MLVRELPTSERPAVRAYMYGEQVLSSAELVTLVMSLPEVQVGEAIITRFGGLQHLGHASVEQLMELPGVGKARALMIRSAVELGKRISLEIAAENKPIIRGPQTVYDLLKADMESELQEIFKVLILDIKNQVTKIKTVSIGMLNSSLIHPRELYREAIGASASSVIISHNHPSGDPTPSHEDIAVTKRLREAGQIIGIELLDHVIIGQGEFISLKERGLM